MSQWSGQSPGLVPLSDGCVPWGKVGTDFSVFICVAGVDVLFPVSPLLQRVPVIGLEAIHSTGGASLVTQMVRNSAAMRDTQVQSLKGEAPLQEGMATHSSVLAWRVPWTEEPGGLQSMGLQ